MIAAIDLDNPLFFVIIAVGIATLVVGLIACVVNFLVYFRYFMYNRKNTASMSGREAARAMLDNLGMGEYNVEKCGFIRMIFFGNSYSPSKKTVFLRSRIFNNNSITSVAMACQKVGLAVQHRDGDKKFLARYKLMFITVIGPQALFPLLIVGVLLDLLVFVGSGLTCTLIALFLGLALFICSGVFIFLQIPVEKKAVKTAEQAMIEYSMMNEEEMEKVQKLYKVYILNFILTFVMAILQVIKTILQIIAMFTKD